MKRAIGRWGRARERQESVLLELAPTLSERAAEIGETQKVCGRRFEHIRFDHESLCMVGTERRCRQ